MLFEDLSEEQMISVSNVVKDWNSSCSAKETEGPALLRKDA